MRVTDCHRFAFAASWCWRYPHVYNASGHLSHLHHLRGSPRKPPASAGLDGAGPGWLVRQLLGIGHQQLIEVAAAHLEAWIPGSPLFMRRIPLTGGLGIREPLTTSSLQAKAQEWLPSQKNNYSSLTELRS